MKINASASNQQIVRNQLKSSFNKGLLDGDRPITYDLAWYHLLCGRYDAEFSANPVHPFTA
jgi:hypothetical protein